jgi:hypothetical protein
MKTFWSPCPHLCNRLEPDFSALGVTWTPAFKVTSQRTTLKLLPKTLVFLPLLTHDGDIRDATFRSSKSQGVADACWPHVEVQDPCARRAAAVRAHCADPPRRRRSRRLSSRRLSGAGGGGLASGLARREHWHPEASTHRRAFRPLTLRQRPAHRRANLMVLSVARPVLRRFAAGQMPGEGPGATGICGVANAFDGLQQSQTRRRHVSVAALRHG